MEVMIGLNSPAVKRLSKTKAVSWLHLNVLITSKLLSTKERSIMKELMAFLKDDHYQNALQSAQSPLIPAFGTLTKLCVLTRMQIVY